MRKYMDSFALWQSLQPGCILRFGPDELEHAIVVESELKSVKRFTRHCKFPHKVMNNRIFYCTKTDTTYVELRKNYLKMLQQSNIVYPQALSFPSQTWSLTESPCEAPSYFLQEAVPVRGHDRESHE